MTYLVIMFLLAGAGILRLWLQQRRERSHKDSVDGFRAGLQAISSPSPTPQLSSRPAGAFRSASDRPSTRRAPATKSAASLSLDPARREAAKRRLEARRRAVHRSA